MYVKQYKGENSDSISTFPRSIIYRWERE